MAIEHLRAQSLLWVSRKHIFISLISFIRIQNSVTVLYKNSVEPKFRICTGNIFEKEI